MKSSLRVWSTMYCEGTFQRCERYQLAMSGVPVPASLLPNGKLLDAPLDRLRPEDLC